MRPAKQSIRTARRALLACCLGTLVACAGPGTLPKMCLPVIIPESWGISVGKTDEVEKAKSPEKAHAPPAPSGAGTLARTPRVAGPPPAGRPLLARDLQRNCLRKNHPQGNAACLALAGDTAASWLTQFDDPVLHALVAEALGRNFDLDAAHARVLAAQARARQAGAARLPEIGAGFSASRAKNRTVGVIPNHSGTISNRFGLDANISWEADLWGRLGNTAKAAAEESEASRADYRATRLALAGNVARAWFESIEAGQQLRLSNKTVTSYQNSLKTTEQRYRLGIGSALDTRLARENLATALAQREIRARNRDAAVRSLEILLGRYPAGTLNIHEDLPGLQKEIPAGLPSELLDRRPDIIGASARLSAKGHQLLAARTNRLPSLGLTASAGTASDQLRDLTDWDTLAWTLAGNLLQPIWRGGELRAQVSLAGALEQEAWAQYTAVVLQAFREVESTLTAENLLARQEAALRTAEEEATAASALALDRYRQGLSDIVTLLSTQRREFTAKSSLIAITKQRLQTRVDLHLALGGGF